MTQKLTLFFIIFSAGFTFGGGPVPVILKTVQEQNVAPTRPFEGTSVAIRTAKISAKAEGIVLKRRIWYGVETKKNQVILELDDSIEKAREEALHASYIESRQRYEMLKNGPRVEQIEQARSVLEMHQAELAFSRLQLDRAKNLHRDNASTKESLDQSKKEVQRIEELVSQSRWKLTELEKGFRVEEVAVAKAQMLKAKALLKESKIQRELMQVRAPFSGIAGEILVEEGGYLDRGAPIAELYDLSFIDVVVLVPEHDFPRVKKGSRVRVRVPALSGKEFEGLLASTGPAAMHAGKTVPVIVRFKNPHKEVLPGMSIQVDLPLGEPANLLLAPKDSILRSPGTPPKVYVEEEGKAALRVVSIGREFQDKVEVLSGVKAGEKVVVRGNERLQPGSEIVAEK